MTQNFNMDLFRQELGVSPLHIGIGGLTWNETNDILNCASKVSKAKNYYVCLDLSVFRYDSPSRLYNYLYEDTPVAKLKYAFSYEAWLRYAPVDVGFMALKKIGYTFPKKYQYSMSIDRLDDWSLDFSFGEEVVLKNYKSKAYAVSKVDTHNLYENMVSNMDKFIQDIDFESGNFTFFFPPYSCLHWCDSRLEGYFEPFISAKKYLVERLCALGCQVYDFQPADLALDLNNYKDTTHYSPEVNDFMVRCFASGEYAVTPDNFDALQDKLRSNAEVFYNSHRELFGSAE